MDDHDMDGAQSSIPTQDFPLFSQLPKELRLRIWEIAANDPRAVIIQDSTRGPLLSYTHGFISQTPFPVILQVCSESREVALKHYSLCTPHYYHPILKSQMRDDIGIWSNFKSDTVLYGKDWISGSGWVRPCAHAWDGTPQTERRPYSGWWFLKREKTDGEESAMETHRVFNCP